MSDKGSKFNPLNGDLLRKEMWWRDHSALLNAKGYTLRPRLRPGWVPSWKTTGRRWIDCEDHLPSRLGHNVVDATRISDSRLVHIKYVETGGSEHKIATMFSSPELRDHPQNHCAPIIDEFQDEQDPSITYLVSPFFRHISSPPFETVQNVIDFVDQILEGLVFMHDLGVAHRDCEEYNIMMDADPLYPQGFHPIKELFLLDAKTVAPQLSRVGVPIKYYFIDFGLSSHIPADVFPKQVLGDLGREVDVPELSCEVPYDPFKVDIFILGCVLEKHFRQIYANLGFLAPLIESMTRQDPQSRPNAREALEQWQYIRSSISIVTAIWRLRCHDESLLGATIFDSITLLRTGVHTAQQLYHWFARRQFK